MKFWILFLTLLAWGLWFGGTVATFVFGLHFFAALPKDAAGEAANAMFESFAPYELGLSVVCLAGAGLLLVTYPTRRTVGTVFLTFLAFGIMVTATLGLMPQMKILRNHGQTASTEWKRLHGRFMIVSSAQAVMLALIAVPLLATADPTFRRRERIQEDAAAAVLPKRGGLSQRL